MGFFDIYIILKTKHSPSEQTTPPSESWFINSDDCISTINGGDDGLDPGITRIAGASEEEGFRVNTNDLFKFLDAFAVRFAS